MYSPDNEGQEEAQELEYQELDKSEVLKIYKETCEEANIEPHEAFVAYLEETYDENDQIDIIIQGNDKWNFTNRIDDKQLMVLCKTLLNFAIYIQEIDLRYNKITDFGAKALAELISKAPRLLSLSLQGNNIKSEGA